MPRRNSSSSGPAWASRRMITAGAAAVLLAAGTVTALAASQAGSGRDSAPAHHAASASRLVSSACSGPVGAAYIADAGWDGFSAIDTSNCNIIQTYNVGDPAVPGDPGDQNFSSTDEAVAIHGSTLYFADTGNNMVSVIDSATLDPSNFNPAETDIHVGFNPQDLAVTPDGTQLWATDTGPQTSPSSPSGISVISTASDTVTAKIHLPGDPAQVTFSPSGARAYVTTARGLWVYGTATRHVIAVIPGLGDPHGVLVSPDGKTVYVTNTAQGAVEVISALTDRVTRTIKVGQMPWLMAESASGGTLYVADPNSDEVSVISTATGKVTSTIPVTGGPDTLALTPDGSQLWVGGITSAIVTVFDTATGEAVGSVNLGGDGAQSGDGYEPSGMVLVATPTPGGSQAAPFKPGTAKASAPRH
jgi:YVTN family beta-propeller protein